MHCKESGFLSWLHAEFLALPLSLSSPYPLPRLLLAYYINPICFFSPGIFAAPLVLSLQMCITALGRCYLHEAIKLTTVSFRICMPV
ncbi:hypothetical protein BDW72DRAFT_91869 [Aspergillus terricola var. indicus]